MINYFKRTRTMGIDVAETTWFTVVEHPSKFDRLKRKLKITKENWEQQIVLSTDNEDRIRGERIDMAIIDEQDVVG